jgi:hypothetical protein
VVRVYILGVYDSGQGLQFGIKVRDGTPVVRFISWVGIRFMV